MGILVIFGIIFLIVLLVILYCWRKELWQWFIISRQPDWLNWEYASKKEISFLFVSDDVTDISTIQSFQKRQIDDYRISHQGDLNYCYAKDYEKLLAWLAKNHQYVPWTTRADSKDSFDQEVYFKKKVQV